MIASGLLATGYWRELMFTVAALLAIALVMFSARSGTGDSRNTRIAASEAYILNRTQERMSGSSSPSDNSAGADGDGD